MKDDKYVEEKKNWLYFKLVDCDKKHLWQLLDGFIRTICKEIEDKFWAREQYHLDTIKELKKQLDEKEPKVSREDFDWIDHSEHKGYRWQRFKERLKEKGIKIDK